MSYTQYLGAQRCCLIPTQGPVGPAGPGGVGLIGPMGSTGPAGVSMTGPTGRGCLGPTGPMGSSTGSIGPSGPSTSSFVNTTILNATYNPATSTVTLPTQSTIISYYNVNITGGNLTTINANNLPAGYQATLIVGTTSITTPSTVSINLANSNNLQVYSNPSTFSLLAQTQGYSQYATITIISDGTYYYANVAALTNQP
jgi:hypothetical protein